MYQYSKAVAIKKSVGAQWLPIDISAMPMLLVFSDYSKVVIELTNNFLANPVYVDFSVFKDKYGASSMLIHEVLNELGDVTLSYVPSFPNAKVKYCRYSDAFRAGYKIALCDAGRFYPPNYPKEDLHDLALNRPNYPTDISLLHKHCLVTVNGMLHMTDADDNYCYVYKGADSLRKSNLNQLGLISFLDVATLEKKPIPATDIFAQNEGEPYKYKTYVKLPGDLKNKYVLLSLGGYLMFPGEPGFQQVNDNVFSVNFNAFPFLERVFESSNYLDLTSLGLDIDPALPEVINVQQLFSDEVIVKYLTLSQTFFIVFDTDNLFFNKIALRNSNLPGMFTAYQEPEAPLVVGYGKLAEYWKNHEDGHWAVNVADSYYRNYAFNGRNPADLGNVSPALRPFESFFHSKGHLLEIGTYRY